MSARCQFTQDCHQEVTNECFINNKNTFLCHTHLLALLSSGTLAHSVKSVNIILPESSKTLLLTSLSKALSQTHSFLQSFNQTVQKHINRILEESSKVEKEIQILNQKLFQAATLVQATKSVKSYQKIPEIIKFCLEKPEDLAVKLNTIKYFEIWYEDKDNVSTARVSHCIDKLIGVELNTVDPVCPKKHPLKLSQDSIQFYSFVSNSPAAIRCDECQLSNNEIKNHCRQCCYDLCDSCAAAKEFKQLSVPKCSGFHLTEFMRNVKEKFDLVVCDVCRSEIFTHSWRCRTCDFDMCEKCAYRAGVQPLFQYPAICDLGHRFVLASESERFECRLCGEKGVNGDSWKCESCKTKQCKRCMDKLGNRGLVCPKKHEMVNKCGKKSGFLNFGGKSCGKCAGRMTDFGFSCKNCDFNLCEVCFLVRPQEFYLFS